MRSGFRMIHDMLHSEASRRGKWILISVNIESQEVDQS